MHADFWHQKWQDNAIGFHESEANPHLLQHFETLSLAAGKRIFLPLCGKTLDIAWLLSNAYRVAGAELSETAVEQLFVELNVKPTVSAVGELKRYSEQNIDIFVGDIFDLSSDTLGPVDAVYDRAALVALPEETRRHYAAHITKITHTAPQLLVSIEYDQSLMAGPPFSLSQEEVNRYYEESYNLNLIASTDIPGGLKGKCAALEHVWRLDAVTRT